MSASERDVLEALGCTIVTNYVPTADPFVMEADCSPDWPSDTEEELPLRSCVLPYKRDGGRGYRILSQKSVVHDQGGVQAYRWPLGLRKSGQKSPDSSQTRSCTALSAISVINQGTGGRSQCQSGSGAHVQL